jgi:hypothetical protein
MARTVHHGAMGTGLANLRDIHSKENLMATSPLAGGGPQVPRRIPGTGTEALGPSDTSDSASDIVGADGAVDADDLDLSSGTNDDVRRAPGAAADIGDANLDSDTDSAGTGERAEAGRDTLQREAPDIAPDHIEGTDDLVTDIDALGIDEGELESEDGPEAAEDDGR